MRIVTLLLCLSLGASAQNTQPQTASFTECDSLGKANYEQWKVAPNNELLAEAQKNFKQAHQQLSEELRFQYALNLARLFKKDTANVEFVVEWYLLALKNHETRTLKDDYEKTDLDEVKLKSNVFLEFTKVYSRQYGECQKALDYLKEYNTDFWFAHMKFNKNRKPYEWTWNLLLKEDQFLNLNCK